MRTIIRNFYSLIFTILAWIIPLVLYAAVNKDTPNTDIHLAYKTGYIFEYLVTASILLGTLHWLLNKVTDLPTIRKLAIGLIIVIRFVSFIFILALYDAIDIMTIFDERFSLLPKKFTLQFLTSSQFLGVVLYFLFIDTIYAWFYQIRTILGKTVFRNLLLGKYRTPRAEKRIFMFIDMKDSTKHAEQLGHVKFTKLIQECFRDFGLIAEKRGVDIYQYIGDEVVTSWFIGKGIKNQNCLHLYYDFQDQLLKNWPEYLRKYNVKPVFKAGIHCGHVTVAEIGLFKRGIEYLSDVLNTASRIQGLCNKYQSDILISKEVFDLLDENPDFQMEIIQDVALKGKSKKVDIFSVKHISIEGHKISSLQAGRGAE
jgi:adenylate cyclase